MKKTIRFLKINNEIIDLLYVDEITNKTHKGYDLCVRYNYDYIESFTLCANEGEKLYEFIYKHWKEFNEYWKEITNKNNYKTLEYKTN